MRLITYNIAYGTGFPKSRAESIFSAANYIRTADRAINKIARFIETFSPDIAALVEVDAGSFRTGRLDQAQLIASKLESYNYTRLKYMRNSFAGRMPILKEQCNAVLTRESVLSYEYLYFSHGMKRLVIKLEMEKFNIYLVHLALTGKVRAGQIIELGNMIDKSKPCIVTGDFNTLKGRGELSSLCGALNLKSANTANLPTYPAWAPRRQLDFALCSKNIHVTDFQAPKLKLSDHLPLIVDFEIF